MGGGATIPQNDQPRPFPDDHGNNNEEITVQVVPPVFADIFKDKVAKLTCKVTNLPSVEGLVISWWKENGGKLDTKTLPQVLQPNGFFGVDGVATVYADEWDKGEIYTCKVSHPELLFPAEVKLQKTPSKSEGVGLGEASAGCKKNGENGRRCIAIAICGGKRAQTPLLFAKARSDCVTVGGIFLGGEDEAGERRRRSGR